MLSIFSGNGHRIVSMPNDLARSSEMSSAMVSPCSHIGDLYPSVALDIYRLPAVLMCVQTLMDPDKRAAYDALMGFTSGAINPFNDKSYTPDKVFVSEYDCIGALISLTPNATAKCLATNQV